MRIRFYKRAWSLVGVALLTPSGAASQGGGASNTLLSIEISVSASGVTMSEFVDTISRDSKLPISFIQADRTPPFSVVFSGALGELLGKISSLDPQYKYSLIRGRAVIHPNSPKYGATSGFQVNDSPRLTAAIELVNYLKTHFTEFGSLQPPFVFGNPESPTYLQKVSVSPASTILGSFVDLLGDNQDLSFVITSGRIKSPILFFRVRRPTPEAMGLKDAQPPK